MLDLTVSIATACAGFPPADAESKGKDASEIPHKPWEWKDNQVRVTRLASLRLHMLAAKLPASPLLDLQPSLPIEPLQARRFIMLQRPALAAALFA